MVGFDLFEINKDVYFFKKNEAPSNLKYLWGEYYSEDNKRLMESGHPTKKTFQVMIEIMKENPSITFELYSNYQPFKEIKLNNLTIK